MGLEALTNRALYKAKELILKARFDNIGFANRFIRATQGGLQGTNRTLKKASICVKAEVLCHCGRLKIQSFDPRMYEKKKCQKIVPSGPIG